MIWVYLLSAYINHARNCDVDVPNNPHSILQYLQYAEGKPSRVNFPTSFSLNQPHFQFIALDNLVFFGQELWHIPRAAQIPPGQPVPLLLRQKYHRIGPKLGRITKDYAQTASIVSLYCTIIHQKSQSQGRTETRKDQGQRTIMSLLRHILRQLGHYAPWMHSVA